MQPDATSDIRSVALDLHVPIDIDIEIAALLFAAAQHLFDFLVG